MTHLIRFYCRESYIANGRYIPYLKETSSQWSLQIKFVEPKDAGLYECQVAMEPKVSSRVRLFVTGKKMFFSLDTWAKIMHDHKKQLCYSYFRTNCCTILFRNYIQKFIRMHILHNRPQKWLWFTQMCVIISVVKWKLI